MIYFLFSGPEYCPFGGMANYRGAYPSIAAAQAAVWPGDEWAQIVVCQDGGLLTIAAGHVEGGAWVWSERS